MKVKKLIKLLLELDMSADVVIEETVEFQYSEVTTCTESTFKDVNDVIDLEGKVVITYDK